jgi:hypothetical protein
MRTNAGPDTDLLVEIRRRRAALRSSMDRLERVLASPYRADGPTAWAARLRAALTILSDAFGEHIAITEGPGGLYRELAGQSPRLGHAADRLAKEHAEITRRLAELLTSTAASGETQDVPQVRRAGTDLLVVLMRHRQRGADLVFEAYDLDIGGET